ncbi:MAG: DUF397 domain-containing protein [Actinomycetota bacterium]|nr:DUF397 domain-containing protein [Actinomycetota bacterium]
MRDTRYRSGSVTFFTSREWSAFTAGVRNSEFDL